MLTIRINVVLASAGSGAEAVALRNVYSMPRFSCIQLYTVTMAAVVEVLLRSCLRLAADDLLACSLELHRQRGGVGT